MKLKNLLLYEVFMVLSPSSENPSGSKEIRKSNKNITNQSYLFYLISLKKNSLHNCFIIIRLTENDSQNVPNVMSFLFLFRGSENKE